jgi:hypothetical protein
MMRKIGFYGLALAAALFAAGCKTSSTFSNTSKPIHATRLVGHLDGPNYTSAKGDFSVPFPVSAEVGGDVQSDGPQTVTFRDNWGSRITFSSLPFNAKSSMTTMLATEGREKALTEFVKRDYGDTFAVHYHPEAQGGAISFLFLRPVSPKMGVAAFIHGQRVYLVETDLLPGVQLLGGSDAKSQEEREVWLEQRAVTLAQSVIIPQ